jgi:hypothetical protein
MFNRQNFLFLIPNFRGFTALSLEGIATQYCFIVRESYENKGDSVFFISHGYQTLFKPGSLLKGDNLSPG